MDANPRIMGDSAGMRSHGWAQEPRMRRRTTAPPDWESPPQPSDRALRAEVALKALCADGTLHPDEWFPVSITVKAARREAARAIAICTACPARGALGTYARATGGTPSAAEVQTELTRSFRLAHVHPTSAA